MMAFALRPRPDPGGFGSSRHVDALLAGFPHERAMTMWLNTTRNLRTCNTVDQVHVLSHDKDVAICSRCINQTSLLVVEHSRNFVDSFGEAALIHGLALAPCFPSFSVALEQVACHADYQHSNDVCHPW